jgi:uncharacterized protein YjdB
LKETRNLAVNPYDITANNSTIYPHAVATQTFNTSGEFDARNAIDGFKNNLGHGDFPVQSWGPVQKPTSSLNYKIELGAPAYVDSIGITIRADFAHDTYYTGATLLFSDGTSQKITLAKTDYVQTIKLNSTKYTSSVTIKDFTTKEANWAALTEVEVFGTVLAESVEPRPLTGIEISPALSIVQGSSKQLTVTYKPSNTTDNRTVTWISSNTSIATVDSMGNIKGLKAGTATITAKVGSFTKSCAITVTSPVPTELTSSKYAINKSTLYLSKIAPGTTVSTLLNGINEQSYAKVYNGSALASGTTKIGTGMTVKIMDGSTVKKTYTIVVTGDSNGDGAITISDMLSVKAHTLKLTTLAGPKAKAADTNGDGTISISDFLQIKAYTLKIGQITAK